MKPPQLTTIADTASTQCRQTLHLPLPYTEKVFARLLSHTWPPQGRNPPTCRRSTNSIQIDFALATVCNTIHLTPNSSTLTAVSTSPPHPQPLQPEPLNAFAHILSSPLNTSLNPSFQQLRRPLTNYHYQTSTIHHSSSIFPK